jgi:hypothetical protein
MMFEQTLLRQALVKQKSLKQNLKFKISELPEGTACHVREQRGAKRWRLSKGCRPRFLFRSEKN